MSYHKEGQPVPINTIENWNLAPKEIFATANANKLREIEDTLGREITGMGLDLLEIQDMDPFKVAEAKAYSAWATDYRTKITEDTSLELMAFDRKPGPFVKHFMDSIDMRKVWCDMAHQKGILEAKFRVILAAHDGKDPYFKDGEVSGTIAKAPRGMNGFGFDDIFEPDGQELLDSWDETRGRRTYAEMTSEEKRQLSARTIALNKLKDDPFVIGKNIYRLVEPPEAETNVIRKEELQDPRAVNHAFKLASLRGNEPNPDFEAIHYEPFYIDRTGGLTRVVTHPESNDLGILTGPWDVAVSDVGEKPIRLAKDSDGSPVYWQDGPQQRKRAIAARAEEFQRYHNDTFYDQIRKMKTGETSTVLRSNQKSEVIETLLGIVKDVEPKVQEGSKNKEIDDESIVHLTYTNSLNAFAVAGFGEVGYERLIQNATINSRKTAADFGLFLDPSNDGNPKGLFEIGYMPQASFRDILVASALSFQECGISRNSYLAHPDKQIALFQDVRDYLQELDLPNDIYELCLSKVGIAIGVESPEQAEKDVARFYAEGCTMVRMYSTNNDMRTNETPKRLRQNPIYGDKIRMYVMPIVNYDHAKQLIHPDVAVDKIGVGHGGGENCESLGAGAVYTGLKLLYELYQDPDFNNTSIGIEGGGDGATALIPMLDFISKDKKMIACGIEGGGLYVQHSNNRIVQPYHGSASAITQAYESMLYPDIAKRRYTAAGFLRNIEGKPNYMPRSRSTPSVVNRFQHMRMLGGLMLADHGVQNINQLRQYVHDNGFNNHYAVSNLAANIAASHRSV